MSGIMDEQDIALLPLRNQFVNGSFHCFFLADKRDEILCPTDLDWKDPFRDDWLRKTLGKLRSGINLTVIMDRCHSGTITRVMNPLDAPRRQRYFPCPLESSRKLPGTLHGQLSKAARA